MVSKPRILIVEDDPVISMLNRNRLTKLGYEVTAVVSTGEEALSQTEKNPPDLALMDIKLEGLMDGIETADVLRNLFDIPVIYVTAYTDESFLDRAKKAQPLGYLVKPYGERELRSALEMALYRNGMEKKLRRAHECRRLLLTAAATAIFTVDSDRRITEINKELSRITGFEESDLIGKPCSFLLGEECSELCALNSPAGCSDLIKTQSNIRTKAGINRTVLKNTSLLRDEKGQVTGGIESFIDVTELIQARLAAEQAGRAKSDFLTNMSHELRTPLNAIIGFSELLLDRSAGELNEEQALYLGDVRDSGRHLLELINGILDLAKVEAGKMELKVSLTRTAQLIKQSIVMIKEKAMKHGLTLNLSIDDELERRPILADELKLKQIMYNLLSNAAKFTPAGGTISVTAIKKGTELLVGVSDTGIGLKREDRERIFEAFEQVDSSYTRRKQGTGLGLALTRNMVRLHGGRIWVESEGQGRGCAFYFTIPIPQTGDRSDERQN